MKLVFPNGERGQVLLGTGVNTIGSLPQSTVVLTGTGVHALHCEIHLTGSGANLQVPQGGGPASVNGKPVVHIMALRSGDQIGIGEVVAKVVPVDPARSAPTPDVVLDPDDDLAATRVRAALPKFVLRGVAGAVLGKVFPVTGPVVIGRAPECDITVHVDEISRRHALVKPVGDGLSVEDLESSNGTYINATRVQQGFLSPGDELRLDAVRFVLVAPGVETSAPVGRLQTPDPAAKPGPAVARRWLPIVLTAAVLLAIAGLVLVAG